MATQVQKGAIFGLSGALIDLKSGAYYSGKINITGGSISPEGKWEEVENQDGEIGSVIICGDYLQGEFTVLPQSATSIANAESGAKFPPRGTAIDASGFGSSAIPIGPFTISGINSVGSPSPGADTMPWIFMSGRLNMTSTDKWTMTWTMRRYKNITTGAAVT